MEHELALGRNEARACVRVVREGDLAVSGSWTAWVNGGEGLQPSTYLRQVGPD